MTRSSAPKGAAAAVAAKQNDSPEDTPQGTDDERTYQAEVTRQRAIHDQTSDLLWANVVDSLREVHSATREFHAGAISPWRYAAILRAVADGIDSIEIAPYVAHGRRRAHGGQSC